MKYATGSLLLGNITLKIEGELTINESGESDFEGVLKSFDDVYDFNASTHRGIIGEVLTLFGRKSEGEPYHIKIRGEKEITE